MCSSTASSAASVWCCRCVHHQQGRYCWGVFLTRSTRGRRSRNSSCCSVLYILTLWGMIPSVIFIGWKLFARMYDCWNSAPWWVGVNLYFSILLSVETTKMRGDDCTVVMPYENLKKKSIFRPLYSAPLHIKETLSDKRGVMVEKFQAFIYKII